MLRWVRSLFQEKGSLGESVTGAPRQDARDDPDENDEARGPYIPGFDVSDTSAALAQSKSIAGTFCRWHLKSLVPTVVPLWRTFLDDAEKWSRQGRFAGSDKNCGHFLALSEKVAAAEARHYDVDLAQCALVAVRAHLDRMLDLTTIAGRRLAFEAVVDKPDASDPFIAEEIIEEPTGGTVLTDRIGYWAAKNGYEGILYVAPRAVWEPERKAVENTRFRKPWDYDLFSWYEQEFRDHLELNAVVFRGRHLLKQISQFRVADGKWIDNELFGLPEADIEAKLASCAGYAAVGEAFQERKRRTMWTGKIVYQSDVP
jgi:hypothetical protein